MSVIDKIKTASAKTKLFVNEHKQTVLNVTMLLGLAGAAAAIGVLSRRIEHLDYTAGDNDAMLLARHNYTRGRIYEIERHLDMPVHPHDQRVHEAILADKAASTTNE
jgi:hypothetical protein